MSYYNRAGKPISSDEWSARLRSEQRVAATYLPCGHWVSTVWLGLNHQFGDGPPLIFETMAFPCDVSGEITSWREVESDRYSTEDEATAGHWKIVDRLCESDATVGAVDPVGEKVTSGPRA